MFPAALARPRKRQWLQPKTHCCPAASPTFSIARAPGRCGCFVFGCCALNDKSLNCMPIFIIQLREISAAKSSPDKRFERTAGSVLLVQADQRADILARGAERAFAQLCFDEVSHHARERYGKGSV